MTTGWQKSNDNNVDVIVLIAGATAANAVTYPAAVLAEAPAPEEFYDLRIYRRQADRPIPDTGRIVIYSTAGSGVMTLGATRVFGAHSTGTSTATGGPLGIGTDALKGMLNEGDAFGETSANGIYHSEEIPGLSSLDGIAVQLGAIAGTLTAIRVELHLAKTRGT